MALEPLISLELAGVVVVSLTVAIVAGLRALQLESRWAPLAAVLVGVDLVAANQLVQVVPRFDGWHIVLMWGIAVGLMAVGLHSGMKNTLRSG